MKPSNSNAGFFTMYVRCLGVALTLATAVIVLSYATPSSAEKPGACPGHPSCKDDDGGDGGGGINSQIPVCATFRDAAGDNLGSDDGGPYCDRDSGQVTLGGGFRLDTGLRGNGHDKEGRTVEINAAGGDNCSSDGEFTGFTGTTDVDLQVRPIVDKQYLDMKVGDTLPVDPDEMAIIVGYRETGIGNAFLVIGRNPVGGFFCDGAINPDIVCTAGNPCTNWTLSGTGEDACLREDGEIVARCDVPFAIDICDVNGGHC